jgi:hypothetical protein
MVDVVSIVIAVISLVGSLTTVVITGLLTLHSDKVKRLSESEKLVAKYRDPLLLAAVDLQSRLGNILEKNVLNYYNDPNRREFVTLYTAFLIGQYFSWTYILRRKVQFLRFSTDKKNKSLSDTIIAIQEAFSTGEHNPHDHLFMLWRPQQMAIGEIMTVAEGEELFCIKYSDFTRNFNSGDATFREWFKPIIEGITELAETNHTKTSPAANRLRRLQHLIVDLIDILDAQRLEGGMKGPIRVSSAPSCECTKCTTVRKQPNSDQVP